MDALSGRSRGFSGLSEAVTTMSPRERPLAFQRHPAPSHHLDKPEHDGLLSAPNFQEQTSARICICSISLVTNPLEPCTVKECVSSGRAFNLRMVDLCCFQIRAVVRGQFSICS